MHPIGAIAAATKTKAANAIRIRTTRAVTTAIISRWVGAPRAAATMATIDLLLSCGGGGSIVRRIITFFVRIVESRHSRMRIAKPKRASSGQAKFSRTTATDFIHERHIDYANLVWAANTENVAAAVFTTVNVYMSTEFVLPELGAVPPCHLVVTPEVVPLTCTEVG